MLLLCPEPVRPVSQGVKLCDTRSGGDLAPLRARIGSGVWWLYPQQRQPAAEAAVTGLQDLTVFTWMVMW